MTRRSVLLVAALSLFSSGLLAPAPLHAHEAKEVASAFLGYNSEMQAALADDSIAGVAENAARVVAEAASYANHSADKLARDALAGAAAKADGRGLAALREQFKGLSVAVDTFLRGARWSEEATTVSRRSGSARGRLRGDRRSRLTVGPSDDIQGIG